MEVLFHISQTALSPDDSCMSIYEH